MHAIRTMLRALLIPLGGLAAAAAGADEAVSRWSFGTQLGQVEGRIAARPMQWTENPSTMSYDVAATWGDDKRFGWRVFTGYQFTNYFAVHVGYTDLGKLQARFAGEVPERLLQSERLLTQTVRGVDVGLQIKLPLSERVAVAFRGGKYYWKSRTRVSESLPMDPGSMDIDSMDMDSMDMSTLRTSRRGSDKFFGAGVEVGVLNDLTATLGWTRYQVADDPIALWTVGVLYGFSYF